MDSVFQLSNGDRASYILNLMHSFGCSYICLWKHSPIPNLLHCEDGYYQGDTTNQVLASSSLGSVARRLFEEYKNYNFAIGNDFVPGLAFKHRNPYLELQESDVLRLASLESQRQFYLEARIKIAVFLGCERGEIELGMSNIPQMSLEMQVQRLFPQDFAQMQSSPIISEQPPQLQQQQNRLSPSSSFSMDSPEYPALFYTIPSYSPHLEEKSSTNAQINASIIATNTILSDLQNIPFPTPESTDAALTRAYLAILSSPSSPTSMSHPPPRPPTNSQQGGFSYGYQQARNRSSSAFTSYPGRLGLRSGPGSGSGSGSNQMRSDNLMRQTMLKRIIAYFRGLNHKRIKELASQGSRSRPTDTQMHHMISERRRREKINESFQALRSLLPQGTKKDKASVLRSTKEYMSSLKSQLSELIERNKFLEAQALLKKEEASSTKQQYSQVVLSTNERFSVGITPVMESTSGERMVDLQVMVRGSDRPTTDLIIRVLEFVNQVGEVSLVSMDAQTHHQQHVGVDHDHQDHLANWATFRLRIEGTEWDESAFKDAVKRLLAEFAQ